MKNQNKLLFKKGGSSLLEDSSGNIPTPDDTWSYGMGRNAGIVDNMLANQVIQDGSGKGSTGKKPVGKKPVGKKPVGKKPVGKKPVGKKTVGKKTVGKKTVGKKVASSEIDPMKSIQNILQDILKKVKSITK